MFEGIFGGNDKSIDTEAGLEEEIGVVGAEDDEVVDLAEVRAEVEAEGDGVEDSDFNAEQQLEAEREAA